MPCPGLPAAPARLAGRPPSAGAFPGTSRQGARSAGAALTRLPAFPPRGKPGKPRSLPGAERVRLSAPLRGSPVPWPLSPRRTPLLPYVGPPSPELTRRPWLSFLPGESPARAPLTPAEAALPARSPTRSGPSRAVGSSPRPQARGAARVPARCRSARGPPGTGSWERASAA